MTKCDEALRLLRTIRNHHPFCAGSGCAEIDAFLADKDIPAAREAVLVEAGRALLDALGQIKVASSLRHGRPEVMLRIGNLHAALAGISPAAALAQGERESALADSFVAIIEAEGYLPEVFKAKALQVAKAALSIREKARAALAPGEEKE